MPKPRIPQFNQSGFSTGAAIQESPVSRVSKAQPKIVPCPEPLPQKADSLRPAVGDRIRFRNDNPAYAPFEVLEVLAERVRVTHPSWKYDQGLLKGRLITDLRPIDQIEEITHA